VQELEILEGIERDEWEEMTRSEEELTADAGSAAKAMKLLEKAGGENRASI
jgi:hypothetical protein